MKSAFIALVGRPSCGKSTLLNKLCGHKVAIVSPVPQTTRNRIRGIVNSDRGQLVFVDTPGFHLSERKFNLYLKEIVFRTLKEVDLIVYLIDSTRLPGEEEHQLMKLMRRHRQKLVIALNKTDVPGHGAAAIRAEVVGRAEDAGKAEDATSFTDTRILEISGLSGEGLDELLRVLLDMAPEGERLYPEDFYTDQPPEFRIAEIIREKTIQQIHGELPHAIYVEISDLEIIDAEEDLSVADGHPSQADGTGRLTASQPTVDATQESTPASTPEQRLWVRGFIYTERESQKGIVVGKQGSKIKTIVAQAQAELNELFPYQVQLDIRVKVRPKWRKKDALLKGLIS